MRELGLRKNQRVLLTGGDESSTNYTGSIPAPAGADPTSKSRRKPRVNAEGSGRRFRFGVGVMTERIRQIYKESYESYGMPQQRFELIEHGERISRQHRVRLVRAADIHGSRKRGGSAVTTHRDRLQTSARDYDPAMAESLSASTECELIVQQLPEQGPGPRSGLHLY